MTQTSVLAGKYVPPSMRETTEDARLNRKVRGLLNRLTQSNLHSIATQLISFYNDNPQSCESALLHLPSLCFLPNICSFFGWRRQW